MAVHGAGLLLGFKAPLLKGEAVILKLDGIEGILAGKPIGDRDLAIWKTLALKHPKSGTACGISDLLLAGGDLYVLSTGSVDAGEGESKGGHAGDLWVLDAAGGKPRHLRDFGGLKAEGISRHGPDGLFFAAIDNGSDKPSQILKFGTQP
jgi:hypothetical protein